MSTQPRTVYEVICDRCGAVHWDRFDTPVEASEGVVGAWAETEAWAEDESEHTCNECLKRDREDACGARPQGHVFETLRWLQPDDGRARYRMRGCRDCHYPERQEHDEWEPWTNYREEDSRACR